MICTLSWQERPISCTRYLFVGLYIVVFAGAGTNARPDSIPATPRICRCAHPCLAVVCSRCFCGRGDFQPPGFPHLRGTRARNSPQMPAKIYRKTPLIYRILSEFIDIFRNSRTPEVRLPAIVLIRLGGAHGNHADELHGLARIVVEGVVLAGRHEYGRTRRDGLGLALDDHPPLALQHEHLMLPGVGVVGRLPARLDFDDPHRHPGLAVALAQEPADARALGRLLRLQFRVLVVHHLHGVTPPWV